MHTALVVSTALLLAGLGDSMSERITHANTMGWIVIPDLPAAVLIALPIRVMDALIASSATKDFLVLTAFVLLGGLQWYLIGTLLAFCTCGFQRAFRVASAKFIVAIIVGSALAIGCAFLPWGGRIDRALHPRSKGAYSPPPVAFDGDSKKLRQSVIVPTLDEPVPAGKNAVWCATFQMAWERLKDDVAGEPIEVTNAGGTADRLNHAAIAGGDLPDGSYYAAAGFTDDGIVEKIRREMRERFQVEPADLDDKGAEVVAFAYLRANVPFTLPYFENDEQFRFTDAQGKRTRVSSFGLREKDQSSCFELRDQVEVLYLHREGKWGQPDEFALDLCRDSRPNQVILACVPRKTTLLATLEDLERKMAKSRPDEQDRQLGSNSTLLVPNLNWKVSHHFAELEGANKQLLNTKLRGLWIKTALQTIDFRLDCSGVSLESKAHLVAACADPCFVFDRPFLIVVKKRGAARPFFVMWVDNAELLCKPVE